MKGTFYILLILLSSCMEMITNSDEDSNRGTNNSIVGEWVITVIEQDNVSEKCNVCPEIEFSKNGTGKITKPSKEEISFTYTLSSDSNKVVFSFEDDQAYFDKKEYFYEIHTKNKLEILELSSKDGTSKYTFSRETLKTSQ